MLRTHESVIRQRKAIIRLFDRPTLEKLVDFDRPERVSTFGLRLRIEYLWPEQRIIEEFGRLMGQARKVDE